MWDRIAKATPSMTSVNVPGIVGQTGQTIRVHEDRGAIQILDANAMPIVISERIGRS
jgi:hypothetical protein